MPRCVAHIPLQRQLTRLTQGALCAGMVLNVSTNNRVDSMSTLSIALMLALPRPIQCNVLPWGRTALLWSKAALAKSWKWVLPRRASTDMPKCISLRLIFSLGKNWKIFALPPITWTFLMSLARSTSLWGYALNFQSPYHVLIIW